MPVTLRPTTGADLQALDRLFADSYPALLAADYPAPLLAAALPLIARAQPHLLASGSYYMIEEDGAPLAAGGWTAESPHGREAPGIGHIRHVVTHPSATRRGLASRLLDHCIAEARAAGLTGLVAISTRTAVPFYRAKGFAMGRRIELPLAPGIAFPAIRMARPL
jgi:GNAT superfamily N-acetyltransferase